MRLSDFYPIWLSSSFIQKISFVGLVGLGK